MSESVLILGEPGSGKSSSIGAIPELGLAGLDPAKTMVINVEGKRLPFAGSNKIYNYDLGNYYPAPDVLSVTAGLKSCKDRKEIATVVIDDFQYALSNKYVADLNRKAGGDAFAKWNEMLEGIYALFHEARSLREDQVVFILSHIERVSEDMDNKYRMKLVGKGGHKYLSPEGKVSICLIAESSVENEKPVKRFRTQSLGNDPAKSPHGMFKDLYIKNDLSYIRRRIYEYYELGEIERQVEENNENKSS